VWCGVVWCGVVWRGVVWCGVVWRGVAWCGVVWRGVVWFGVGVRAKEGVHLIDGASEEQRGGVVVRRNLTTSRAPSQESIQHPPSLGPGPSHSAISIAIASPV
jgi:hypothetical protein